MFYLSAYAVVCVYLYLSYVFCSTGSLYLYGGPVADAIACAYCVYFIRVVVFNRYVIGFIDFVSMNRVRLF